MPDINTTVSRKQRIRYYGTISALTQVTRASILSLVLAGASTDTTTMTPLYTSARVLGLRVHIPGIPTAGSVGIQSIVTQWMSDLGEQSRFVTTNMSSMGTSSKYMRPPRLSRASMWSLEGSQTSTLEEVLFQFGGPNDTDQNNSVSFYVDVDFEFKTDSASLAVLTITTSPGTGIWYVPLDNLSTSNAIGSWKLFPVGLDVAASTKPAAFTRSAAKSNKTHPFNKDEDYDMLQPGPDKP